MTTIEIVKARVLLTNGMDKIDLITTLPCPFVSEFLPSQPSLQINFDATQDTGVEYCRKHLKIEPEVTDVR